MELIASPEQDEIASSSASFLASTLPLPRTRELIGEPSNVDTSAWSKAAELGWFGLALPESRGGVGFGLADEAVLFREVGRSLAAGPFLSTVLGARVASFAGDGALAAEIIAGRRVGLGIPARDSVTADESVRGELQLLDAVDASLVLVALPHEAHLVAVDTLGTVTPVPCVDDTSRLAHATITGLAPVATVTADVDPVERRGNVLAAALLTGIAEATRDIAAEHAKSRVQFDRPIGVHQAVKHPCADMAVRAELSWAQTLFGAVAIDEDRDDAELQALSAKVVAADAAEHNAAATVQVLGGIGYTFEHDAHLYVKRAHVLGRVFGETRDGLSRLLLLPKAE
jgi:alkylation response protein AidB-like acyl-CoA dehydrogenase